MAIIADCYINILVCLNVNIFNMLTFNYARHIGLGKENQSEI